MKTSKLQPITDAVAAHDADAALDAIRDALRGERGVDWIKYLGWLAFVVATNHSRFKIFARDGNKKLPFVAYSSLPGEGFCPGAGACLTFCYSFKAHRYPAAYGRQAQNSWLMASEEGRAEIADALDKFERSDSVDFRLYVDGDFGSAMDVVWWMEVIRARPWLAAYGYSKSWNELLLVDLKSGFSWPSNYKLNLSSGSNHDSVTKRLVSALPITRGEFIAVDMGHKVQSSSHGDRGHNKELRTAFAKIDSRKAFTCPGQCGSCTPQGHACGSERFRDIPIIIAVH